MTKVLLLGKGFVGTKLAAYLEQKQVNVFSYSRNVLDYSKHLKLSSIVRENNFSHIINCCGYTGVPNVDACETNKQLCWNLNVTIAKTIDDICATYNKRCIHISSGCIYTGYEKEFTEQDEPNFGLFNNESSFYSKSKHAFETVVNKFNSAVLRIRMPFTNLKEPKNYLYKILSYDNLISQKNSLTSIDDLNNFVYNFIPNFLPGTYNVVNTQPVTALEITEIMKRYNIINKNWRFVEFKDLGTKANRSNCVLDTSKIKSMGLELSDTYKELERCIKTL